MNNNNFNVILVVVLVCISFWLGVSTNDQSIQEWTKFKDILSILISALTLFIAWVALNRWKKQHKYEERYKAIVSIEEDIFKCYNAFNELKHSNTAMSLIDNGYDVSLEWQKAAEEYSSKKYNLEQKLKSLYLSKERYNRFFSNKEKDEIESILNEYFHAMDNYTDKSRDIKESTVLGKLESSVNNTHTRVITFFDYLRKNV
ncbi:MULTISPECIES: hypothetical protein [unclassified Photobacterium]|uniref:hypothetical protein n=1 Tax=unclassified Photobacterium TaxID=2628852 RepID=UPI000D17BCA0|nr:MULTISPECIES: hypothetical protein [unclassified Photobacterium]PSV25580.1 hypothetical protein C9J42_15150 [Photobacterium sp. GB-56]PSV29821.1 hypothetical protein C9J40_15645 [Photobacterium sp. GB-72]